MIRFIAVIVAALIAFLVWDTYTLTTLDHALRITLGIALGAILGTLLTLDLIMGKE